MLEFIASKDGMGKTHMNTTEKELGPRIEKIFGPP
jgi:hypothetical protein